jgi:ADP-ribosylation factor related protein 1
MFSLLHGLINYMLEKQEYFVPILGLDGAGKTTLLEKSKTLFTAKPGLPLDKITSTVGLNLGAVELQGVKLTFWDLGGAEGLRSIWTNYYKSANALIWVVDGSDTARIEKSRTVFEELADEGMLDRIPIVLVVNKNDIKESRTLDEIRRIFNIEALLPRNKHIIYKTMSAVTGDGIKDTFDGLAKECIKFTKDMNALQKNGDPDDPLQANRKI